MTISPQIIGLIGILVLLVLIFSRVRVGLAMAFIGFIGFWYLCGLEPALKILATVPYTTLASYHMSVIPLFVFMGVVIANMGIGEDLYYTANTLIGQVRCGLSLATTLACALFGAITSSSLPALVTLGKIALPEMKKYNYSLPMASASLASAGTLGALIPPSQGLILYSVLTQQSIGKLFMAGLGPGVLMTILFLITLVILTWIKPDIAPPGPKTSFKQKVVSIRHTWSVVVLFLLVIGGIYGGIFTPTEGGAIGAFGAIVISAIMKRINRNNLYASLMESVRTSGMVLTLIMGGFLLGKFVAVSKLPFELAGFIAGLDLNRFVIFAVIIVIYIILGMFMDIFGAIVLTVPILFPVIIALGFDPIWYGVVTVMLIEIGLVTPPIGLNVFTLSGFTGIPAGDMFKYVWPFVAAMVVCIIIITIWPQIALFIPSTM